MTIDDVAAELLWKVGGIIWKAVSGGDSAENAGEKIAEAMLKAAVDEAKRLADVLGVVVASDALDAAASRLLAAMHEAEGGGGLPRILDGAQIEYVHVPIEEGGACRNCGAVDLALPCPGPRL